MEAKTYNGYANYETWAVCLWLENDESSYRYWKEAAGEAKAEAAECWQVKEKIWPADKAPLFLLADRLKDEVTDGLPDLPPSLYSDLLNAALCEVDWPEVAEAFLEEEEQKTTEPQNTQTEE